MSHSVHMQVAIPAQDQSTSGAFYAELFAWGDRPTTTIEISIFGEFGAVATSAGGHVAELSGVDAA